MRCAFLTYTYGIGRKTRARGFFAELQRQSRIAKRDLERAERETAQPSGAGSIRRADPEGNLLNLRTPTHSRPKMVI